jgi:HAE1 family hydrophobic/amphiphilic exporter-1
VRKISLQDAVILALENNRDIEVERANVKVNEQELKATRGIFDPTLNSRFAYERRNLPNTNALISTANGGLLTTAMTNQTSVTKRLANQGGRVQLTFTQEHATTQNLFDVLNPLHTNSMQLSFVQPLMKNRRTDADRHQINVASKRLDLSDSQFRQRVIEIIAQVHQSYWNLVFAHRDSDIKAESLQIGQAQLAQNQRHVEAGTLAPVEIISTKVEVERRTEELALAREAVQQAENKLKALLLQPAKRDWWDAPLLPTEQPNSKTETAQTLPEALAQALRERPELEQFRLRGEWNETDIAFFKDQSKPQVDLEVSYGTIGVAGNPRTGVNPLFAATDALQQRVNQLSVAQGLPALPALNAGALRDDLRGGAWQSLGNTLQNDFRTLRVGVSIQVPLGNTTARANLGRALAEQQKLEAEKQRTMQMIEAEVRNAWQGVATTKERIAAATSSRENAELLLRSEQRKYEAGQTTNYFVLERQNALASARARELRAWTDYHKAVAEMNRALSITLTSNHIALRNTARNAE